MEEELNLFEKIFRVVVCFIFCMCFGLTILILSPFLIIYFVFDIPFMIYEKQQKKRLGEK